MSHETINREVGENSKGFRLQRLRAIRLLLDALTKSENVYVFAAIEYYDDVYFRTVEDDTVEEYAESDKDYTSKDAFSFNSPEVKNSLVSFLDCWFTNRMSESLYFGFYTNVLVGKEKHTQRLSSLQVTIPKKPIINLLKEGEYSDEHLLPSVKTILLDEYRRQYEEREESGYIEELSELPNEIWIEFLKKIDWQFDQEDHLELEETLLTSIRKSNFYGQSVVGKEKFVLARLIDEFDKRQGIDDPLARMLSKSDVNCVFLEVASGVAKRSDPVYEQWELIAPTDKRNLTQKIKAVCSDYDPHKFGLFARKISGVKLELGAMDTKDRGAYLYRIYDACDEKLIELLNISEPGNEGTVNRWIDELVLFALHRLEDKSQDYSYSIKSVDTLRSAILDLFDSCYHSFERGNLGGA